MLLQLTKRRHHEPWVSLLQANAHSGVVQKAKTYNSGDSLVVTHLTTNPPVSCLNRAERTGSLALSCRVDVRTFNLAVYNVLHTVLSCL
jgi:hypothetical protein